MSKENKFRAWDDGKMIYSHNNQENPPYFQISWFFAKIREDAIVMKFTGLKDKHVKECFEGDIVEYYTNVRKTHVIAEIKWEQQACAYWLKWVEVDEKGTTLHRYRELTATFSDGETYQCDFINIIGNIHKNPELLKQN